MPVCTCPCPLHASEADFDVEAFWDSLTGGTPRPGDNSPARLVFMGDGRVGTSSLIKRFTRGLYESDYKPEVAKVMRHMKTVFTSRLRGPAMVQFWDIEGSDVRTALLCAQKAHAVAVVYDITNRSSFELAQRMLNGINPRASVILMANKCDLETQRKVSSKEGKLLSRIHRVVYMEVSAKLNYKVDPAFQVVVDSVPEEYMKGNSRDSTLTSLKSSGSSTATAPTCVMCHQRLRGRHKGHDSEGDQNARRRPEQRPDGAPLEKTISI